MLPTPSVDADETYSTWDVATHGPEPRPHWVVTALAARDTDLGVLKTGKDADVHLISRAVPHGPSMLAAAKRYRTSEHRLFHRDAGYTEGRRTRRTRDTRAMAHRTQYGRDLLAAQWATAEFAALSTLWSAGAPVPYPIQQHGTELLLEFLGTEDGAAAPRLAQLRPSAGELPGLFDQCLEAMRTLARLGFAHGDLSAYNVLVHEGRIVLIDLPQVVDVVVNPQGAWYLQRDCENLCSWFRRRGLDSVEYEHLLGDLMAEAVARW